MSHAYPTDAEQRRPAPFSLRLTALERTTLERRAGSMSLGSYIKSVLFAEDALKHRSRGKAPVKDHVSLGELLARLGASRIANNLNQLAHAANTGTLFVDDETRDNLNDALADIRAMRLMIMRALGLVADDVIREAPHPPAQEFAQAASPQSSSPFSNKRFRL